MRPQVAGYRTLLLPQMQSGDSRIAPVIQTQPEQLSSRKRKLEASEGFDVEDSIPKHSRLTRQNLQKLEKMGESKHKSKSSGRSRPSSEAASTSKSISTTTSGFVNRAHSNGIFKPTYSQEPLNIEELREQANRARETESPSESEYKTYVGRLGNVDGEDSTIFLTGRLLQRDEYPVEYSTMRNQALVDVPKNVGFNNGLSPAQPDHLEGLTSQAFEPFQVREKIEGAAVRPGPGAITLSHFAGEFKAPGENMILGEVQAAYDGASLVYLRDQAKALLETPDPPRHAFITSFVTDGGLLRTYAHHSEMSSGRVEYHQTRIDAVDITNSHKDYKKGRRHVRNLQDHAKHASYALRDQLVASAKDHLRDTVHRAIPPCPPSPQRALCDDTDEYNADEPSKQLLSEYAASFSRMVESDESVASNYQNIEINYAQTRDYNADDNTSQACYQDVAGHTEDYEDHSSQPLDVQTNFSRTDRFDKGYDLPSSGRQDGEITPTGRYNGSYLQTSDYCDIGTSFAELDQVDNAYNSHVVEPDLEAIESTIEQHHPVTPPKSAKSSSSKTYYMRRHT